MSTDPIRQKAPGLRPVGVSPAPAAQDVAAPAPTPHRPQPGAAAKDHYVGARPPSSPAPADVPDIAAIRQRRASAALLGDELQDAVDRNSTRDLTQSLDSIVLGEAPTVQAAELLALFRNRQRGTPDGPQTVAGMGAMYGVDMATVATDLERDGDFRRILHESSSVSREALADFMRQGNHDRTLRDALVRQLYRKAIDGSNPEGLRRVIDGAQNRESMAETLGRVLDDRMLEWIQQSPDRRTRAEQIVLRAAPTDPSIAENRAVDRAIAGFRDWARFPYQVLIVPGFTPLGAKEPVRMHPEQRARLEQAVQDFRAGLAPFILLSGGNVHPPGTPYHEALEMKRELLGMGVPEERIIVDARARHSTTNLRNAGRYMLDHGLSRALVTTSFGQDFYFSFPGLSTFHHRSRSELGYEVGRLGDEQLGDGIDTHHSSFTPAPDVRRVNLRDPLDP
jgi:DUF218 domain-containing protein